MAYLKIILTAVLCNNFVIGNAAPYPQENEDAENNTQYRYVAKSLTKEMVAFREGLEEESQKNIFDIGYLTGQFISGQYHDNNLLHVIQEGRSDNFTDIFKTGFEAGSGSESPLTDHMLVDYLNEFKETTKGNFRNAFVLAFNLGKMFGGNTKAMKLVKAIVWNYTDLNDYSDGADSLFWIGYNVGVTCGATEADPTQEFEFPEDWLDIATLEMTKNSKALFDIGFQSGAYFDVDDNDFLYTIKINLSRIQSIILETGFVIGTDMFGAGNSTKDAKATTGVPELKKEDKQTRSKDLVHISRHVVVTLKGGATETEPMHPEEYTQAKTSTDLDQENEEYPDNLDEIERSIFDIAYAVGGRISKDAFSPVTDNMGKFEITYDNGFEAGANDSANHRDDGDAEEFLENIKTVLETNIKDDFVLAFNLGKNFGNYSPAQQTVNTIVSEYSGGIGIVYSLGYNLGVYYSTLEADPAQASSDDAEFELPTDWINIATNGITNASIDLFNAGFDFGEHVKKPDNINKLKDLYTEYSIDQSIIHASGLLIGVAIDQLSQNTPNDPEHNSAEVTATDFDAREDSNEENVQARTNIDSEEKEVSFAAANTELSGLDNVEDENADLDNLKNGGTAESIESIEKSNTKLADHLTSIGHTILNIKIGASFGDESSAEDSSKNVGGTTNPVDHSTAELGPDDVGETTSDYVAHNQQIRRSKPQDDLHQRISANMRMAIQNLLPAEAKK